MTDAHLVLGRIPPALLGGELPLDVAAARAAIGERVARPLGLAVEEAAAGIVEIVDNGMARAIRTVSVGRGHDPRRFALIPFGGAGPLHGCRLADLLAIPSVIVPPRPGVLSTWGLLDTDIRATFVRTVGVASRRAAAADPSALEREWADLAAQAEAWLAAEQVPADRRRFERSADLRYEHQSFELTCPLGDGPLSRDRIGELIRTFHAEHRRLYTYDLPNALVELVNLRVTGVGILPKRVEAPAASAGADARSALAGERPVYFRGARRRRSARLHAGRPRARDAIRRAGHRGSGRHDHPRRAGIPSPRRRRPQHPPGARPCLAPRNPPRRARRPSTPSRSRSSAAASRRPSTTWSS